MEWFRLWHDFFSDPKLKRLSKSQRYDLLALINLASCNSPRGQINLDDDDISEHLDQSPSEFCELLEFLIRKGIVSRSDDGTISFVNWAKRQPSYDSGAVRMQQYRARKKMHAVTSQPATSEEPLRNGDVTVTHRTEQNREEKIESARARATSPTLADCEKWMGRFGGTSQQAEKMFWHYEAKGWPSNGLGIRIDALVKKWLLGDAERCLTDSRAGPRHNGPTVPPPVDPNTTDPEILRLLAVQKQFGESQ